VKMSDWLVACGVLAGTPTKPSMSANMPHANL